MIWESALKNISDMSPQFMNSLVFFEEEECVIFISMLHTMTRSLLVGWCPPLSDIKSRKDNDDDDHDDYDDATGYSGTIITIQHDDDMVTIPNAIKA